MNKCITWFARSAPRAGYVVLVAAAVVTAGCASVTGLSVIPAAEVNVSEIAPYFDLKGRISVRVNDRIDSGQLQWNRSNAEERLGLYSPLGSQVAEVVQRRGERATMVRGAERTEATSIDDLATELLGVSLGTERVARWVQGGGLVDGQAVEETLANGERWMVTAERFQVVAPYRYARRISAVQGDIVVRLVIDEWHPL